MIPSISLSVQDFFGEANWQGLRIVQEEEIDSGEVTTVIKEETIAPKLSLTVGKFFSLNNWQGLVKFTSVSPVAEDSTTSSTKPSSPRYNLSMKVGEFFQRMSWRGDGKVKKANIASLPKIATTNNQTKPPALNVNDLSDLL